MKLQRKTLAMIAMAVGAATALTATVASYALRSVAQTFEVQAAIENGLQIRRWVEQDLRQLSELAQSHSLLPNVAAAILGEDDTYAVYSLAGESVRSLRLTEIWLLDANVPGKVPLRLIADSALPRTPQNGNVQPDHHERWLKLGLSVLNDSSGPNSLSTVLTEGENVFLFAARPVRESTLLNSPVIGVLLMARQLGHEELKRVSETLMAPVALEKTFSGEVGDVTFRPLSETRASILVPMPYLDGQPPAQLVATVGRDMYRSITSFVFGSIAQVILLGLLLGTVLIVVLNRFVLQRVNRISSQLQTISLLDIHGDDLVRIDGDDELSGLAKTINGLLQRIRSDFESQQLASQRHETLQLQLMQSQKMEAIGRFSGGVAHDFNNSLAGTNGWIRLAIEDLPEDHPSREALEQALKGSQYSVGLIKQLMAFSRQSEPRFEHLKLSEVVSRTCAFVSSGLMKRTQLDWDWSGANDTVLADPTQLQQVLVNLLINASDSMEGKGTIKLRMNTVEIRQAPVEAEMPGSTGLKPGQYLHLQVRDAGTGIAKEHLDRVFEPFFTTKAIGRGTGLGLSVAHGIMSRHHGSVGVESELGKGTCFHIWIPAITERPYLDAGVAG